MRARATLAALLLTGCTTVGPNYRQPDVAVPAQYAEPHEAQGLSDAELASWWRQFGDPQLDSLIARAIALNLDVQSAAARIREARARELVAGARNLPTLDGQASATRQRISENAIPTPPGAGAPGSGGSFGLPGSEFSTFRVGLDASWEIDLFGGTRRGIEAAGARTGAAIWDRRDLQASAAAEVAIAYFTLRTVQERMGNAEADLARLQREEQLRRARFKGGLINGIDVEQQKSEAATAAAELPTLQAQAEAQIHAIGLLTGTTPEALIAELSPAKAIPASPAIPTGLPSDLLRRRPDIRAAERDIAAATADIGVATADLYPRISLTAAPALVSTALASLLDWGSRSYSIGASLLWPLFDGGKARANIAVADAKQEQELIAYRKTVLVALKDVEDALSRTQADRDRLADLARSHDAATRAEALSRTRFRGGLVTYSDVITNQGKRLSVEKQMIETRGALARDSVALFKALGGGWPEQQP
jgi:NodT family efflux transporter outer membrane factor (OMF) lipoprotein